MSGDRSKRARKLTYVAIAVGFLLAVAAGFLPPEFRWFLIGVVVGMFVTLGLVFSDLFWKQP